MPTIKEELIINAPIEKVWGVITDFGSYAAWNPFIQNIELNGKLEAGTVVTLHALMKPGAAPTQVQATLTEVQAPRTLNWSFAEMYRNVSEALKQRCSAI